MVLVHVGRNDLQTKVRGHRVELAEVEIALLEIAGIEQAAAVARQQRDGGAPGYWPTSSCGPGPP